jgi:AcrR family transcriptional regulator
MSTMIHPQAPAAARTPSLSERHTDQTRQLILSAAADLLENQELAELTNAAVAARAGVSERTVYRHFMNRDALLDGVAVEVASRLQSPPVPDTPEALLTYPQQLFASFEARHQLTRSALASEVFARLRDGPAARRWQAVQRMLDNSLPALSANDRAMAAANIRYLLTATTWNYYRQQLGLTAEQTVCCVRQALSMQLHCLGLLPEKTAYKIDKTA